MTGKWIIMSLTGERDGEGKKGKGKVML